MTDSQRAKVYGAEQSFRKILDRQYDYPIIEIAGSKIVVPLERKFGQIQNIQAYVDQVSRATGMSVPPTVRERRGQTKAHYEAADHVIAIPTLDRWAMREIVVLHELAHAHTRWTLPAHGWEFCQKFLELVARMMGYEAELIFKITLMEQGADLFGMES